MALVASGFAQQPYPEAIVSKFQRILTHNPLRFFSDQLADWLTVLDGRDGAAGRVDELDGRVDAQDVEDGGHQVLGADGAGLGVSHMG